MNLRDRLGIRVVAFLAIGAAALGSACGGAPRSDPESAGAGELPVLIAAAGAEPGGAADPSSGMSNSSCGVWGCVQERRFAVAAALIKTKPGSLGVVVLDRTTGAVWKAGAASHIMWASSTMKLAVVTSLLEQARSGTIVLDATANAQISAVLRTSDNEAADALWARYGKDALVGRFQSVYGMTGLTFVSGFPRTWGFMKCSAEDLQRLMSYILDKLYQTDRDFLIAAMRKVGAIQQWGVWAAGAALQPGVKDGWSVESDAGAKHWCVSTVGFAGSDARYAVAEMYDVPVSGGSLEVGVRAVSDVVATVFGVTVPAKVTVPGA